MITLLTVINAAIWITFAVTALLILIVISCLRDKH